MYILGDIKLMLYNNVLFLLLFRDKLVLQDLLDHKGLLDQP